MEDRQKRMESRLTALEIIDREMSLNCPLYPGKANNGPGPIRRLEARLDIVEKNILEGKWLLRCIAVAGAITWGKDWWPIIAKLVGLP